jgi:hypothetical protein
MDDRQIEEMKFWALILYVLLMGIFATFSVILGIKCYKKRRQSKMIKQHMMMKKSQYATALGLNLYEIQADPRFNQIIHL